MSQFFVFSIPISFVGKRGDVRAWAMELATMNQLCYIVTGTGRSGTVGLAASLSAAGIPCSHERFFSGNSLAEALRLIDSNGGENSFCSRHCGLPGQTDHIRAESSYMAAPYLNKLALAETTVIHAVRNPWHVILSFLNNIQFFRGEPEHEHEQFVYSVLPRLHTIDNPIDRAVYYYIHWNAMIETLGRKQRTKLHYGFLGGCQRRMDRFLRRRQRGWFIFHRIEDGTKSLLRKLGISKELIAQSQIKTELNSFKEWPRELRHHDPVRQFRIEDLNASKYARELKHMASKYGYESPQPEGSRFHSRQEATSTDGSQCRSAPVPRMLEAGYRGFNLVRWRSYCYALPQYESINLQSTPDEMLKERVSSGEIFLAQSLSRLKEKVEEISK